MINDSLAAKHSTTELGVIERELEKHGSYASVTRGLSMRPLFKTSRDMVIIKKPTSDFKKYDVVLYTGAGNKYTMHRIIGFKGDTLLIRGDNTYEKEYVPRENVIGILTEFNRKGKHHTVEEFSFKLYSRFWNFIYPVRYVLYRLRRLLGKIYRSLFKSKSKSGF